VNEDEVRAARDRFLAAERDFEHARADLHYAIRSLHAAGGSMREIAQAVGLSHQRVHQIVDADGGTPAARKARLLKRLTGRGDECEAVESDGAMFDRAAADTREAFVRAQQQAHALGHNYLGTEHVLLGLLGAEGGLAARLLSGAGMTEERARAALQDIVGGPVPVTATSGPLAFMPRVKRVLELARKEAKRGHSPHVRGEHVLLGICREGKGVAAAILSRAGIRYDDVRRRLDRAGLACSFCGRSGIEVEYLVAGPGMYICERCCAMASDLAAGKDPVAPGAGLAIAPEGESCGFCGRTPAHPTRLVAGPRTRICGECLALCREIQAEERGRPLG
jgi:hypothetical protein